MNIFLDIFGYTGTVLILLSLMMTSVVKLRIINMSGALISMIYAIICNTWPVVLLNFGTIIINTVQLIRIRREKHEINP